ncbi:hypothetical protein BDV06DRAFT_222554 [Aspergillus oleicola]
MGGRRRVSAERSSASASALSDFLDWNPSLPSTDCVLEAGHSYCVGNGSDSSTRTDSSYCLDLNATEPGTISTCNCFTRVRGYQISTNGEFGPPVRRQPPYLHYYRPEFLYILLTRYPCKGYGCSTLESDYHNLSSYNTRAICIGVDTSSSPTTSLTTTIMATTTTLSSMGPTQTDTVPSCKEFYTVDDGDGCDTIEDQFGIIFAQFYAWNPSIRSNCSNLWLGYTYCVDGPTSTATTTVLTTGPGAPTQTGIAADCTKYHTVEAGDSCATIKSIYKVTFAQLYKWNPAIG